MPELN